jgi:very-short-patch-repair endonuclease
MPRSPAVARAIEALATQQFGGFSRDQALALGATRHTIERQVEVGAWPTALPRVHRVAAVPRSAQQDAMVAALWSAPDGLVSHATAGQLWGFDDVATTEVHITVPRSRHLRSSEVVVHRVSDLLPADVGRRVPIPMTSPLRTATDLAAVLDVDALEIAIESALRRRLFSVGQLRWRADALMGTGRPGSSALRSLLERHQLGATDSGWEVRTAQLLEAAGFGAPVRQHAISSDGVLIARADLAYPDMKLVIEYDSDQWHDGTARRHRDAARRNRLRSLGWTVIEVTPAQLRAPKRLLSDVALILAA